MKRSVAMVAKAVLVVSVLAQVFFYCVFVGVGVGVGIGVDVDDGAIEGIGGMDGNRNHSNINNYSNKNNSSNSNINNSNSNNNKNNSAHSFPAIPSKTTTLSSYSYGTTNVEEFRRLHREHLSSLPGMTVTANANANATTTSTTTTTATTTTTTATTFAFAPNSRFGFIAGYRNQIMALTMLVMLANSEDHKQLLLDSIWHKDTYGTETCDPFDFYFDVEHWNTHCCDCDATNSDSNSVSDTTTTTSNNNNAKNCLPRMVLYDPLEHDQWDPTRSNYKTTNTDTNTRPYGYTKGATRLTSRFQFYAKGKGKYAMVDFDANTTTNNNTKTNTKTHTKTHTNKYNNLLPRNPAEVLMLLGALRPHPALQAVVDRSVTILRQRAAAAIASRRRGSSNSHDGANNNNNAHNNSNNNNANESPPQSLSFRYMTLHARIEPDMQIHPVCRTKKVFSLQEIVDKVEANWPMDANADANAEPPVDVVFLPINRQYLEKEGTLPSGYNDHDHEDRTDKSINWMAVDNLRLLNRLTSNTGSTSGMWNGRVPVVEFGSRGLKGTVYEHRPSLSGSILNYFVGMDADLFVGSEVSSFSHDLLAARFYRRQQKQQQTNGQGHPHPHQHQHYDYKYLPGPGVPLQEWITDDMVAPPGFLC